MNSTIDSKTSNRPLYFLGDKHIDFILQSVFCSNTRTLLIMFLVAEYRRI